MRNKMKHKITLKHIFGNKKPSTPAEQEIYRHAVWFAEHYKGIFAGYVLRFEGEDHFVKKGFDTHELDPYLVQDGLNLDIFKMIVEEVDKKYYDIIDEELRKLNEF